jgi:hypothetical protein
MLIGTGAIVFAVLVGVYFLLLYFERQTRRSQAISRHPYRNPYTGAPGASREGPSDIVERTTHAEYARGTR